MDAGERDQVRAAEIIAALSLATDLGHGADFEHGLRSTLVAMRLGEHLGIDHRTARDTYYTCLLHYVGCTAEGHAGADTFGDDFEHLWDHLGPVAYGSERESLSGLTRAIAPGRPPLARAVAVARTLPKAARRRPGIFRAMCEVGTMLGERLGVPASVPPLLGHVFERWDGKGIVLRERGKEIPMAVRIVVVADDADTQRSLGGVGHAVSVIRDRAGAAFDPTVAGCLVDCASDVLAHDGGVSVWDEVLAAEPEPHLTLDGDAIDVALTAMADFADMSSPYLAGHSSHVAELAADAVERCDAGDRTAMRRAAYVHDLGRTAVPARIWHKPTALTPDDWERVRLHPYHAERALCRSPLLAELVPVAIAHHERMDGSGYHRGLAGAGLTPAARVLAAADAYCAMTQPRPHRSAMDPARAAATLGEEASSGRLDPDAVAAVVEAAGQQAPRMVRPAGLTEREVEVVRLLARGLQTKQVAGKLGISPKTADRHVQNAYAKIGVSTRAGATLFAMQHGLLP
jgi:HD-GYP domain-containing protein (c-di-GMP phosphodiesterase class II)